MLAGTAVGAIATLATGREPGALLGVFVVTGTVAAALAVRPSAGRMILPVPVLSYLVAALVTGTVHDRPAITSLTAFAVHATQWVASGFFAMALATALVVAVVTLRWYLGRRGRRPADPGWRAPADDRSQRPSPGREPVGTLGPRGARPAGGPSRPAPPQIPQSPGPLPPGPLPPGRGQGRTAPRPPRGPGPYNFSSGA